VTSKSDYKLNKPPIFICGVQRSGTTLLVKMIQRNSEVKFLPQETHLYPLLWKPVKGLGQFNDTAELASYLEKRWPKVNYGWTERMPLLNEIITELKSLDHLPKDVPGLMRVLMYNWQERQAGPVVVGEKTPSHIYYALKTLKEFPQCKMVLMCRDPRAAALSEFIKIKKSPWIKKKFDAFNFIVRWSTATDLIQTLNKRKTVHFVKYEDLIRDPEKQLKTVTNFLGIDYSDEMLNVGVTNSSFGDSNQRNVSFNEDNLSRWKTELSGETISLIEGLLGTQMKRLGYELTTNGKSAIPAPQKMKLEIARKAAKTFPARFHHMNRNAKYRD